VVASGRRRHDRERGEEKRVAESERDGCFFFLLFLRKEGSVVLVFVVLIK